VYTPPAGTVLSSGSGQTLSVTFTPSNTANYNAATQTALINVIPPATGTPANLVVTATLGTVVPGNPSTMQVTFTVANIGGSTALQAEFTNLTPNPIAPFPILITTSVGGTGNIPAGTVVTLASFGFESFGPSGTHGVLGYTGTYNSATQTGIKFSGNIRVIQP
jgi:hypothetical protein